MWIIKVILFVGIFGLFDSYAGPKNTGLKVYKHVITVTDITQENPFPRPMPQEDGEMVARD